MKKIQFIFAIFILSVSSILGQTKGKYDLDLYQKRLSLVPKVELGLFGQMAPMNFGLDASYYVKNNLSFQTSFGTGKENNKVEIGGTFCLKNEIKSKDAKVFDKTISQDSRGEVYQVLLTKVNFHSIRGIRGGAYRRGFDISVFEANDMGYDETEMVLVSGGTETPYILGKEQYNYTVTSLKAYNFSAIGVYAGYYIYNSRNTTNSNLETGTFSKGRKNYGLGIATDLLIGGGLLSVPNDFKNSYKIENQVASGLPVGARCNLEFSYYVGKNHQTAFFTNMEFGKYPKVGGFVALWGIGVRIDLLEKIVSN
ncbi:MAG: hypothetical protein ACK5B9_16410 [Flavobacteriia bacterium]